MTDPVMAATLSPRTRPIPPLAPRRHGRAGQRRHRRGGHGAGHGSARRSSSAATARSPRRPPRPAAARSRPTPDLLRRGRRPRHAADRDERRAWTRWASPVCSGWPTTRWRRSARPGPRSPTTGWPWPAPTRATRRRTRERLRGPARRSRSADRQVRADPRASRPPPWPQLRHATSLILHFDVDAVDGRRPAAGRFPRYGTGAPSQRRRGADRGRQSTRAGRGGPHRSRPELRPTGAGARRYIKSSPDALSGIRAGAGGFKKPPASWRTW